MGDVTLPSGPGPDSEAGDAGGWDSQAGRKGRDDRRGRVAESRPLADDEVLLEVRAAGVGNWDEFVRTGGWDVGAKPPMELGVEAAGVVLAVGQAVTDWAPGDADRGCLRPIWR
jgi:hypothetical protein